MKCKYCGNQIDIFDLLVFGKTCFHCRENHPETSAWYREWCKRKEHSYNYWKKKKQEDGEW